MSDGVQVPDWVRRFYADVDAGNVAANVALWAPDFELRFGARAPARGHEEAKRTLAAVHEPFDAVSHRFVNVWERDDTTVCEFEATYALKRGGEITLPTLTVLERRDGKIASMRVYMDEGPLRS